VIDPRDAGRQRAHVPIAEVRRDRVELEHGGVEAVELDLHPQRVEHGLHRAPGG
jgi:hypothetical protein